MRIQFLGANRQVTGSSYYLEGGGARLLVDRGLFQEHEHLARNWSPPPFDPRSLDAVLLTHAHLDHCGLLPRLVKEGFSGPIIATAPTVELARIVMEDSARIQEEDIAYKRKRHAREGRRSAHPYVPLYDQEDAERAAQLFRGVRYGEPVMIRKGLSARFREAGHILGSAMLEIEGRGNASDSGRRIVFSGDVGQWDIPIVKDPALIDRADWVVMESTYGDRDHDRSASVQDQLQEVILDTLDRGGNVIIPAFALERAQEILFDLAELMHRKNIPRVAAYLDSPMAVNVTEVFRRYTDYMDERTKRTIASKRLDEAWEWIHLVRSTEDSKAIQDKKESCIILAGSGMCTGGRIKHHLSHNISRPESTVLFVGYQAPGTLGRAILDGARAVRIFGREHVVRARVFRIQGLSAHAGRSDLLRWLDGYRERPRRLFLTHGEESVSLSLAESVQRSKDWDVRVPQYLEKLELA